MAMRILILGAMLLPIVPSVCFAQTGRAPSYSVEEQKFRDEGEARGASARAEQSKRDAAWDRKAKAAVGGICTGCDVPSPGRAR
ncbi:conserved exported hypothetical protein [Chelatococcus asaccharovorans]|nr:conserved exported hypothetical protein [Chelatococcus asaccharovorans]CAH1676428.1 conserved exported hypothetical protein [Chelatococcus asaccharovorans]